jgi:heterodisulfide reductase subunit A-like polyferredoxin
MNVVIVGGGISGISAAKVILKAGHHVTIIESTAAPGGLMARIANCRVGFNTFYDEVRMHPRLTVINEGRITAVEKKGEVFFVTLDTGQSVAGDRVVIAAGLTPYDPVDYKGRRVLTSLEYDALIDQAKGELPADFHRIAFVLCVGSRSEEYPLCSSVCCSYTIREIKWTLQRAKPEITVFYNDLRLFGQEFYMEKIYRDAGLRFVRANSRYFDQEGEEVRVRYFTGGKLVEEAFDYVVLAIGLRPCTSLAQLSRLFGFSLNQWGFVKEAGALRTDAEGVYAAGGSLEPMSIKDSILTGFGAGFMAAGGSARPAGLDERLYREDAPEVVIAGGPFESCLFYLGTEDAGARMFYEFISSRFIAAARSLRKAGKTVYVLTRNMSVPSYGELTYEEARREGIIFVHLEEGEDVVFEGSTAAINGPGRNLAFSVEKIVRFDDYMDAFKDREFLSVYRSEPQLRWSPTKWGRKRYHAGFIRHPRAERWEAREVLGAMGEMRLDEEEERVFPEVDEERCSGCGSCKDACPHRAIEMEFRQTAIALFGPDTTAAVPIAHVQKDTCVGCGLCASTCPSDVITYAP